MSSICERFNSQLWHDSKLLGLRLIHGGEKTTGDLVLDLMLRRRGGDHNQLQTAQLVIQDCTLLTIKLDVEAKAACSHDIAGATCQSRSEYMELLERTDLKYEKNPLVGLLHFNIELCPPGGGISAIGRDFEIKVVST